MTNRNRGRRFWLAEKPDAGRKIAISLGASDTGRKGGPIKCPNGDEVWWAIGHLLEIAPPAGHNEAWQRWSVDTLPIIPPRIIRIPVERTKKHLEDLVRWIRQAERIVIATDPGREGENIAREILSHAGWKGPVERLWVNALTDRAIRQAIASLREGAETEPLDTSARIRAAIDWIEGMSWTRYYTLTESHNFTQNDTPAPAHQKNSLRHGNRPAGNRGEREAGYRSTNGRHPASNNQKRYGNERRIISVGRVQTAALAMVVERDEIIEGHRKDRRHRLIAIHETVAPEDSRRITIHLSHEPDPPITDRQEADDAAARCRANEGTLIIRREKTVSLPPGPPDLGDLQLIASSRWSQSASVTLDQLQQLYLDGLITYPRTDSRCLPTSLAAETPYLLSSLARLGHGRWIPHTPEHHPHIYNDNDQSDHHAIIPTGERKGDEQLSPELLRMMEVIEARYILAHHPIAIGERIIAEATHTLPFRASAIQWNTEGHLAVHHPALVTTKKSLGKNEDRDESDDDPAEDRDSANNAEKPNAAAQSLIPPSRFPKPTADEIATFPSSSTGTLTAIAVEQYETRPPPRFTEGTLVQAMAAAGRRSADAETRKILGECGIGTKATRAEIIRKLKERGYIEAQGKKIVSTMAGRHLVHVLRAQRHRLLSIEATADLERQLALIERGEVKATELWLQHTALLRAEFRAIMDKRNE